VAAADLALQERDLPALQVLEQELEPLLARAQPSLYHLRSKKHLLRALRFVHPSVDLIAVLEQLVEQAAEQDRELIKLQLVELLLRQEPVPLTSPASTHTVFQLQVLHR